MHFHLDPVGGIAGDMFIAALLDACPELIDDLGAAMNEAGLDRFARFEVHAARRQGLVGRQVRISGTEESPPSRTPTEIRRVLSELDLPSGVRDRALDIFRLLAEAEGYVHGHDPAEVHLHEVGAWDSIADVAVAAWLIEALEPASWSCEPLPLGSGRVASAHGTLPVPAPATARLLEGYPCVHDGVAGERITPTGAAILRHLSPDFGPVGEMGRLRSSGCGFGARELDGAPNLLRALRFDGVPSWNASDRVAVCEFEIDDQTPEDLAVALDRLRATAGVLDVVQAPVSGKKGRLAVHVRLLAVPEVREAVIAACLEETTTLGVRWHLVPRTLLRRETVTEEIDGLDQRTKRAMRPGGRTSLKAEMDDLATAGGGWVDRESRRRMAERGGAPDV